MAHKKGVGSSQNGRESESKRLGIKIFGGQFARAGNIIVRQRGTVHNPGQNTGIGKDHTIFAMTDGFVEFKKKAKGKSYISVLPKIVVNTEVNQVVNTVINTEINAEIDAEVNVEVEAEVEA